MLIPVNGKVIMKEKKMSSIIIVQTQKWWMEGEVVASAFNEVEVGDTVYFSKWVPERVNFEGEEYFVISGNLLLCKTK